MMCSAFAIITPAADERQYIYDDSGKLTQQQFNELSQKAKQISEKNGALFIAAVNDGYIQYGDKFCSVNGISTLQDVVLLIITLQNGNINYDIYTYGDAYSKISDREIDRILDARGVSNIKEGDFYGGISAYLTKSSKAYGGLLWAEPKVPVICGIVVGAIAMLIISLSIVASYKKKMRSTNYPLERYTTINIKESNDIFLGRTVTKVRINSGSSGGGGGGRSSGGGVGGGGGHRGGR